MKIQLQGYCTKIDVASESASTSVLSFNLSVSASSVSGLTDAEQISMPSNVNN